MSELVDMPPLDQIAQRHRRRRELFIVLIALFLSALLWAGQDDHDGLNVTVNWSSVLQGDGAPGLFPGQDVGYQVVVENRGNVTANKVFVQASLNSEGAACPGLNLPAGALIPGAPFSPFRTVTLSPGQSDVVDHSFQPPATLCPSLGELRVNVEYEISGDPRSFQVVQPIRFVVP